MDSLILNLSPHLFWDTNREMVDPQAHKRFIISRTLSRGNLKDFKAILSFYQENELREEIKAIRTLDDKTANFAAVYFSIPKEEMRCYTWKPSRKKHWDC